MNQTKDPGNAVQANEGWVIATDWTGVRGLNVEVYEHGEFEDRGKVDAVTSDGRILWLSFQGNIPRRIIEKLPGTTVRVMPD
ncbi:hypothetical protein DM794_03215 [Paenarthrobacter ureafaciens]|uniref:hypothetical protein n=1 Tax=Paenarthrobacter ureafaciens TaxID=37931 RepID=UPI0015BF22B1|nr:hypothetical protein [Paenarthrobacter ureafaciens]NWL26075.1 hypothetical protein [Paenarthrobacter ureafaciens]